jgi:hypothetical protein
MVIGKYFTKRPINANILFHYHQHQLQNDWNRLIVTIFS